MVLIFTPSVTEINLSVTIIDDDLVEVGENFFGNLTTNASCMTIHPAEAEVTILDRDGKLLRICQMLSCQLFLELSLVHW